MSDAFKFPSGRSVGNCRKDAKRLARQEQIPLNVALDQVASANGISHPWARALSLLDAQQTLSAPKRTSMDQLSYLTYAPVTYRIQAKYLEVGMLHVAQFVLGSFEISRIRGIRVISEDSIQIDLGPEGHANRIVGHSQYVDVPVLPCPNCDEKKRLSTDLHVGTAFVCCEKCGQRGPELLPRGDERALLAGVIRAWNNLQRRSETALPV